jgi:hypothetical protein
MLNGISGFDSKNKKFNLNYFHLIINRNKSPYTVYLQWLLMDRK